MHETFLHIEMDQEGGVERTVGSCFLAWTGGELVHSDAFFHVSFVWIDGKSAVGVDRSWESTGSRQGRVMHPSWYDSSSLPSSGLCWSGWAVARRSHHVSRCNACVGSRTFLSFLRSFPRSFFYSFLRCCFASFALGPRGSQPRTCPSSRPKGWRGSLSFPLGPVSLLVSKGDPVPSHEEETGPTDPQKETEVEKGVGTCGRAVGGMTDGSTPDAVALQDRWGGNGRNAPRAKLKLEDFVLGNVLGEGSYSTVRKATRKADGSQVALKMMRKKHIVKEKKQEQVKNERDILDRMEHPGIAKLHYTFQDQHNLYMGIELCPHGELFDQIYRRKKLNLLEPAFAKHYAAEIVVVLEYLRKQGVVHRDLKPENLLLDADRHLKLVDFGSARAMGGSTMQTSAKRLEKRKSSFVGTADYVSPEVLEGGCVSPETDLWSLGCIVYQLLVGKSPFAGASEYLTFCNIRENRVRFPEGFPPDAQDLVLGLLVTEPSSRLGAGPRGFRELRAHPFFAGIDWSTLRQQEAPPLAPALEGEDTDYVPAAWELEFAEKHPMPDLTQAVPRVTWEELEAGDDSSASGSALDRTEDPSFTDPDLCTYCFPHLERDERLVRVSPARVHRLFRSPKTVLLALTDVGRLYVLSESRRADVLALHTRMDPLVRPCQVRVEGPTRLRLQSLRVTLPLPHALAWQDALHHHHWR